MKTEDELRSEGFKKITASYKGTCSFCHQRFQAGERIFWKREETQSIVCCSRCYEGRASTKHVSLGNAETGKPEKSSKPLGNHRDIKIELTICPYCQDYIQPKDGAKQTFHKLCLDNLMEAISKLHEDQRNNVQ